jgi:hypothetical protein
VEVEVESFDMECCAVKELVGLGNTVNFEQDLRGFVTELYYEYVWAGDGPRFHCAFVIFTQAGNGDYGEKLAEVIKKYKLGTVITSHKLVNPNTKRRVKVFIWEINKTNTKRWLGKEED